MKKVNFCETMVFQLEKRGILGDLVERISFKSNQILFGKNHKEQLMLLKSVISNLVGEDFVEMKEKLEDAIIAQEELIAIIEKQ